jgi:hypothetical protein
MLATSTVLELWAFFSGVESVVVFETTDSGVLVRSIGAVGFAVTILSLLDAFTGATHVLVFSARYCLWWALFVAIFGEYTSTTFLVLLVRGIITVGDTIAKLALFDALTRVAGELIVLASAVLVVVELVVLEATSGVFLVGSISTLGFTVTKLSFDDARSIGTGPFGLWVAATSLTVVEAVVVEATLGLTFIRFISTLGFTVTSLLLVDALSVGTLPLALLTTTFLAVIEWELLEATEFVTFIRSIGTLGFTITVLVVLDALTILAGPFRFWVATTSLLVVEWEVLEATLL